MDDYETLKKYCLKEIKKYPEMKERLGAELYRARISYDNGINLVEDLIKNKKRITNGVIPFLLKLVPNVDLTKPIELKQVKNGGAGGLDRILSNKNPVNCWELQNGQSATKLNRAQRLFRKEVHSSEWKRRATEMLKI